jgi:F0F1-type ATP synthase membrane subunit b/b'
MDELRDSVAGIAVGAAEAVVQKRLDEAAQLRIIEDYVNRAGSTN